MLSHGQKETRTKVGIHRLPDAALPDAAQIRRVIDENARTKTLVLDASIDATPGQFIMAWLPGFDEKPFSLANDDPVTITVARVGPFTTLLHERGAGLPVRGTQTGDRVWIRGPFGHGFALAGERLLLVGGGYGVAPMGFLARRALKQGCHVTIAVGARTADDLLPGVLGTHGVFGTHPDHAALPFVDLGVELHTTTEDGSGGQQGLVTDAVEPLLAAGEVDTVYACGPHGMLVALDGLCREHGVPAQLSWEAYMRCGLGLCGSCEHDGRLLCVDGPVLAGGADGV
ncbi:MAG: Dihydroorotate dehydrogenase B (NAD(+)), electron transfer subunit [Anaerolineales bacterium]|nr:Dihydroorotate dehydrogenase B (NAD(+)), electron transfer subunit [Anaerolineales bacterium]